eukprot:SAG31_NODE_199_length_20573_cov_5.832129_6_plen_167_part_00
MEPQVRIEDGDAGRLKDLDLKVWAWRAPCLISVMCCSGTRRQLRRLRTVLLPVAAGHMRAKSVVTLAAPLAAATHRPSSAPGYTTAPHLPAVCSAQRPGLPSGAGRARIVGVGKTPIGRLHKPPTILMMDALQIALADAGLSATDLDGIVSMPSLSHPQCGTASLC